MQLHYIEEECGQQVEVTEEYLRHHCDQEDLTRVHNLEIEIDAEEQHADTIGENLPNLVSLKLNGSKVFYIRELGVKFQKVRYLWLNRAGLRDLDGLVAALPLLEELYISFNEVEELSGLQFHETLQVLDLEGNQVSDLNELENLASCPKLTELTLEDNPIYKKFPDLASEIKRVVPQLETLDSEPIAESSTSGAMNYAGTAAASSSSAAGKDHGAAQHDSSLNKSSRAPVDPSALLASSTTFNQASSPSEEVGSCDEENGMMNNPLFRADAATQNDLSRLRSRARAGSGSSRTSAEPIMPLEEGPTKSSSSTSTASSNMITTPATSASKYLYTSSSSAVPATSLFAGTARAGGVPLGQSNNHLDQTTTCDNSVTDYDKSTIENTEEENSNSYGTTTTFTSGGTATTLVNNNTGGEQPSIGTSGPSGSSALVLSGGPHGGPDAEVSGEQNVGGSEQHQQALDHAGIGQNEPDERELIVEQIKQTRQHFWNSRPGTSSSSRSGGTTKNGLVHQLPGTSHGAPALVSSVLPVSYRPYTTASNPVFGAGSSSSASSSSSSYHLHSYYHSRPPTSTSSYSASLLDQQASSMEQRTGLSSAMTSSTSATTSDLTSNTDDVFAGTNPLKAIRQRRKNLGMKEHHTGSESIHHLLQKFQSYLQPSCLGESELQKRKKAFEEAGGLRPQTADVRISAKPGSLNSFDDNSPNRSGMKSRGSSGNHYQPSFVGGPQSSTSTLRNNKPSPIKENSANLELSLEDRPTAVTTRGEVLTLD